jgi:hypothetical protein
VNGKAKMNTKELAKLLGASESDAKSFVIAIAYWMASGLSYEDAINRHMRVMTAMLNNIDKAPISAVIACYEDLRTAA